MQEKVKQLRVNIDALAQLTGELKPLPLQIKRGNIGTIMGGEGINNKGSINSKEIKKSVDSLYMAKAWLGKVMGELGVESPYKSGYKTKADIEPTADVAPKGKFADYFTLTNHIEKVDYLRTQIDSLVKEVKELDLNLEVRLSREFAIARTNAYNYLCEARFHLGFELQRIKEA